MHRDESEPDGGLGAFPSSGDLGELAVELQRLLELAVRAIPTCIGVSLILRGPAPSVTLSALRPGWGDEAVMASMSVCIPRPLTWPSGDEAELVVYAALAHAFRDTAPSVLSLLDMPSGRLTLDAHLQAPILAEEHDALVRGLTEQGVVDRAVGILLEQGLIPEDSLLELAGRADSGGTSVFTAAQTLIASTYRLDDQT